jgi:hypothetical protein
VHARVRRRASQLRPAILFPRAYLSEGERRAERTARPRLEFTRRRAMRRGGPGQRDCRGGSRQRARSPRGERTAVEDLHGGPLMLMTDGDQI